MLFSPADEDVRWRDSEEVSTEEDSDSEGSDTEGCIADVDIIDGPRIYLPGSVRCNDDLDFVPSDGLATIGTQDWGLEIIEEAPKDGIKTDGEADQSTTTVVANLTEKWELQEAQVERRRNRRRKQSVEAAMELDRQQRFNQHKQ